MVAKQAILLLLLIYNQYSFIMPWLAAGGRSRYHGRIVTAVGYALYMFIKLICNVRSCYSCNVGRDNAEIIRGFR